MANVKFTDLPVASSVVATDILAISQNLSTTPVSRSVTPALLVAGGLGITPTTVGKNFLDLADPGAIMFPRITAANDVVAEAAAAHRTSLGATTVGAGLFTIVNPSSTSWLRVTNAGGVFLEDAATTKTALSLNNVTNDAQIKSSDFPAVSVDGEVSLFSGTTGKAQKRATGSGLGLLTAGVLSAVTDNRTNWDTAFTDRNKWDGGATGLTAATGRTSLSVCEHYENANAASAQTGFATDQYLTGSVITIPTAGGWLAGGQYYAMFDMTKTAAGVATPIVAVRMGTLGTTGDAAIATITWSAPTAAGGETVIIEVWVTFRSVGSGSTAVLVSIGRATKNNLTTGGFSAVQNTAPSASTGFNSTTQTKIGVSFNGGASFSGTCQMSRATYMQ